MSTGKFTVTPNMKDLYARTDSDENDIEYPIMDSPRDLFGASIDTNIASNLEDSSDEAYHRAINPQEKHHKPNPLIRVDASDFRNLKTVYYPLIVSKLTVPTKDPTLPEHVSLDINGAMELLKFTKTVSGKGKDSRYTRVLSDEEIYYVCKGLDPYLDSFQSYIIEAYPNNGATLIKEAKRMLKALSRLDPKDNLQQRMAKYAFMSKRTTKSVEVYPPATTATYDQKKVDSDVSEPDEQDVPSHFNRTQTNTFSNEKNGKSSLPTETSMGKPGPTSENGTTTSKKSTTSDSSHDSTDVETSVKSIGSIKKTRPSSDQTKTQKTSTQNESRSEESIGHVDQVVASNKTNGVQQTNQTSTHSQPMDKEKKSATRKTKPHDEDESEPQPNRKRKTTSDEQPTKIFKVDDINKLLLKTKIKMTCAIVIDEKDDAENLMNICIEQVNAMMKEYLTSPSDLTSIVNEFKSIN